MRQNPSIWEKAARTTNLKNKNAENRILEKRTYIIRKNKMNE